MKQRCMKRKCSVQKRMRKTITKTFSNNESLDVWKPPIDETQDRLFDDLVNNNKRFRKTINREKPTSMTQLKFLDEVEKRPAIGFEIRAIKNTNSVQVDVDNSESHAKDILYEDLGCPPRSHDLDEYVEDELFNICYVWKFTK